ncbi:HbrB-like-domain-containing protein [Butyriboletus roseoflavus]|nr:HbrB-like-domain-containing protein [Butyriboletus roseoflavus]
MHQAARTASDRVAVITVAPPVTHPPNPEPPYPTWGSSRILTLRQPNTSGPFLSSSLYQALYHQRRLGFLPLNTALHSKTSPSQTHRAHLDPKAQTHSHSRSEITAHKVIYMPNMSTAASSSAVNKVHTSPSKPSTRTYDTKLVTREMHRLGTLAGLNPGITTSLSSSASASTLTLAPSVSPSTVTLVPATSHSHGISALSGATASDKDNPWGTLHVHVLPLFNEEPLRVPIEDLNTLVRRHIQTVLAASPSRALMTLATDARELIGAGMVTINAKIVSLSDELLPSRLVELWSFFWDHILPYVEGVSVISRLLYRSTKAALSSPTRQGTKAGPTGGSHTAFSPTIDVRSLALCAFRDRIVVPLHSRLHTLLSPTQCKETLVRLGSYRQPRLQQMLLVLTSERRVRPPSPTLSLRVPDIELSAGEAAIIDLFRLFSQAQHHARAHTPHPASRESYTRGLMVRASTPSFLSAGIPRDRRGRIGGHDVKRMILSAGGWPLATPPAGSGDVPVDDAYADAEDEGGDEGNETPRVGAMDYHDRRGVPSARSAQQHANTGGWGLGAGNEEKDDDDDDDETMNWDQAQAAVERMIGMKPESPTDMRRRRTNPLSKTGVYMTEYPLIPSISCLVRNVWCVLDLLFHIFLHTPLEHTKDTTRVAAGLKAAIRNPNVSAEAKKHAKEKLKEMGQDMEPTHELEPEPAHVPEESTRVLAGYKATLSNPYTSAEAKAHAEEVLQAAGIHERHPEHNDDQHQARVLGGYKASLRSMSRVLGTITQFLTMPSIDPHVSDEAKQHAREYLKEYGIEG